VGSTGAAGAVVSAGGAAAPGSAGGGAGSWAQAAGDASNPATQASAEQHFPIAFSIIELPPLRNMA
ncbi:hypothetical protein BE11_32720, partial [Sorangium cellulosum]